MKASILLVDDDGGVLRSLERLLRRNRYQVTSALGPEEGLIACSKGEFDVVISDYRMPNINGTEFLAALHECSPQTVRLMLSGEADREAILATINDAKIFGFLLKPWDDQHLLDTVAKAVEEHRRLAEVAAALELHRLETDVDYRRQKALEELERDSPGITDVNWSDNNTIILKDLS